MNGVLEAILVYFISREGEKELTMKLFFYFSLVVVLCFTNVHGKEKIFKVTDFGAIGDRKTESSAAFMEAWKKACVTEGGGVLVPRGTFLLKNTNFEGPCVGGTTFHMRGNLLAAPGPSSDVYWIQFYSVDNLKVSGHGVFYGKGATAWPYKCNDLSSSNCEFPISLKIIHANNVEIVGIKSINSKGFHLHMSWVDNLLVRNVNVRAPADSPNTDGIHIGRCNFVKITNSTFATGDDCVSIGDGTTNVNITGVHCGPGHGISIGSLGKLYEEQSVTGINIRNCTLSNTENGLRIKTFARSTVPITVSDVTFTDINIINVRNPIIIDQYYCPHGSCTGSGESGVEIQGVRFQNVKGTSASPVALNLQCSKARPCQDIVLSGLDMIQAGSGQPTSASCSNANKNFIGLTQIPSQC